MARREKWRFILTVALGLALAGATVWLAQLGANARAASAATRATEGGSVDGTPAVAVPTAAAPPADAGARASATSSGAAAAPRAGAPVIQGARSNEGAGIEFSVTPAGVTRDTIDFQVTITTHAGDLSFDMASISVLRDGQGHQVRASAWNGGKGGHHLQGKLSFPAQDGLGASLLAPGAQSIELVIAGVGGIPERVLAWTVG